MLENEKRKRKLTFKKANLVAWSEEEVDFNDEEENDEYTLLYLMIFYDKVNEVFDSKFSCSSNDDDDINDLYHELYDSLVRAKKKLKISHCFKCLKNENHNLNVQIEQLLSQNKSCDKCKVLKDKNLVLIKYLQNFINNKNKLDVMLEN